MAAYMPPTSWLLFIGLGFSLFVNCCGASEGDQKTYIVYMGALPESGFSASSLHTSMLEQVVGSTRASESLLHSYERSFNGFVAKLTEEEMKKISSMKGVVSVFLNEKKKLHTTRSWDFMGFPQQVTRAPAVESEIIVGMFDTGIWPESDSFNDDGFGPPPSKWRGICQSPSNFTCNNKIIGARYYLLGESVGADEIVSPRDSEGHGTHTASTAAGQLVSNASLYSLGAGTARGGVPGARIAVYKICWADGCSDAHILAAFEDAIADGVDIISHSVGGLEAQKYFNDPFAIGAFHAMKVGILTSNSAGNSGPSPGSIANVSPWSLTVAASTIDREFTTEVKLGNNEVYEGVSVNTFNLEQSMYPLIYAGDAPNSQSGVNGSESRFCSKGTLDKTLVKGKIVLCDALITGSGPLNAGAIGTIMRGGDSIDAISSFPLSASFLGLADGAALSLYITTTSQPTAIIEKSIQQVDKLAPSVASFSSRGPNIITLDILKPDITAPGVNIVAAWSKATTVTGITGDARVAPYNIISGTSMACPHATGAAAYVKSFHPTWSPAAIKSALMTTATPMDVSKNSDAEFAYGSGHLNPIKAASPGLIYDAGESDYIKFLCGLGYTNTSLRLITGSSTTTCTPSNSATVWDLNYPSFALSGPTGTSVTRVFHRTVTNVGSPVSTYQATAVPPPGFTVSVKPSAMSFKAVGQNQTFALTVIGEVRGDVMSGYLVWDDGVNRVRSPIVAYSAYPPSNTARRCSKPLPTIIIVFLLGVILVACV